MVALRGNDGDYPELIFSPGDYLESLDGGYSVVVWTGLFKKLPQS